MGPEAVDRLCVVLAKDRLAPELVWVKKGYDMGTWKLVPLIPTNQEREAGVVSASPILWMKQ